jgi:uncharacterized protein YidB (DUF937 family)
VATFRGLIFLLMPKNIFMLDNLLNLVRENAGDAVINNPAIPNERNEEVMADASSSIMSGLKSAVAGGNTDAVTSLLQGGAQNASSSPLTRNIQDGFVHNLMQKFGLDQGKASGIAGSLIPIVLQKFVHKTNDPSDQSFDIGSILGSLTGGGSGGGVGDILNKMGGVSNTTEEGGMLGKIKGMFN